ncbi:MAG: hypothetical protein ACR2RV_12730 [Verrucomicrobiales bacterium]
MERFFELTLKPYLLITGLATSSVLIVFFLPTFTITRQYGYTDEMLVGFDYWVSLYQHWGVMVAGVGLQLLYSIRDPEVRGMAMTFSGVEKGIFAFMFLYQVFVLGNTWFTVWSIIFIHDFAVTLYSLAYVIYLKRRDPETVPVHRRP